MLCSIKIVPHLKHSASILLVLSCLAVVAGCRKPPLRQVVILTIETLRADHLGCYGYPERTTTDIDLFSRSSALYSQPSCQAPNTNMSFSSMLTGLYPTESFHSKRSLSRACTTLAELCQSNGLVTVGLFNNPVLHEIYGFDQGFDHYQAVSEPANDNTASGYAKCSDGWIIGSELTDKVIALLDDLKDRDFLLWVHYFDPHTPYLRHSGGFYSGDFSFIENNNMNQSVSANDLAPTSNYSRPSSELTPVVAPVSAGHGIAPTTFTDKSKVDELLFLYDGEIRYVDQQVGRLLRALKAIGITDSALLIVSSDHGESFFDHENYWGHGVLPYQPSVHVPLIIKRPGASTSLVDHPVGLVDIFPTVIDFLDIDFPENLRGSRLTSKGRLQTKPVLIETLDFTHSALRSGPFKLVKWGDNRNVRTSLFNLDTNPAESASVVNENSDSDNQLENEMRELLHSLSPAVADETGQAPPDLNQKLRAIGYID